MRSIAEVLASIPIKADRFPHLVELSTDAMLLRRVEIAEGVHVDTLKALPTLRTPPTAIERHLQEPTHRVGP